MMRLVDKSGENKRLFCPFRSQEFWKCIGCIILTANYGNKGHTLWRETKIFVGKKAQTKLLIYVHVNTGYIFISTVLITVMLSIELFYLTHLSSFIERYFK